MTKLFFIGDSITAGAWDERGGWVGRLSGELLSRTRTSLRRSQGFYCAPYNLGVFGDTAPDVLRRLERELLARTYGAPESDTVQIVFSFGVNDSVYDLTTQQNFYTDAEFQDDVNRIIEAARKFTNNISFIAALPVDEARLNPVPWIEGRAYKNDSIAHFNALTENTCTREGLDFFSVFDQWAAMPDLNDYLSDGLHPNSKGHALLAEQIGTFLFTPEFEEFHAKA